MFTKTTILALRAVMDLARQEDGTCWSPRRIAEQLDASPTYMAKALRHLVKAGILRAEKGVKGGVRLGRQPGEITLLAILEACQGTIIGDYCASGGDNVSYCGFHRAALELHAAVTEALSSWTVAQLLENGHEAGVNGERCVMAHGPTLPATKTARAPLAGLR